MCVCRHLDVARVKEEKKEHFSELIFLWLVDSGQGLNPELKPFLSWFSLLQLSTVSGARWDLRSWQPGETCSLSCLSLPNSRSEGTALWGGYSASRATTLCKQRTSFHWNLGCFRRVPLYFLQVSRFAGTWKGRICFFYTELVLTVTV